MIFGRGWHATYGKCGLCIKDIVKFRITLTITGTIIAGKIYGEMASNKRFKPVADIAGTFIDDILRFKATYRTTLSRPHMFYQLFATPNHEKFFGTFTVTDLPECDYATMCLMSTGTAEITFAHSLLSQTD